MVSSRGLDVLRAIVQDYVSSREPVGSKSIVDRHSFGVSAATIRNDMSLLEGEELITAPHTSSGRVPTDKGYRVYVDNLQQVGQLSPAQRAAIERVLSESGDVDSLLTTTVRTLSHLTNQVAVIEYPTLGGARVKHVEIVSVGGGRLLSVLITDNGRVEQRTVDVGREVTEEEVFVLRSRVNAAMSGRRLSDIAQASPDIHDVEPPLVPIAATLASALADQVSASKQSRMIMAGTANLVRTEEDFHGSIYPLLDAIEEQVAVLKILTEMNLDESDISVSIGRENTSDGFEETSVIGAGYSSAGDVSRIGLIGPTRMDYSANMTAVRAVASYLSRILDA